MRTRFLATDYHFSTTSSSAQNQTLDFIRFPLSHLSLPHLSPSIHHHLLHCFNNNVSEFINTTSLEISKLPIDNALDIFFSDVLPQHIDVDVAYFEETKAYGAGNYGFNEQRSFSSGKFCQVEKDDEVLYEKKELENQKYLGSETVEGDLPKGVNETSFDRKGNNVFELRPFEMPELDHSIENGCFSQEDKMLIFPELSEDDISEDLLNPMPSMEHLLEIQNTVYSVDSISLKYNMEQTDDLLEVGGLAQGQIHSYHNTFPLLEVDETSLGISTRISMEDELLVLAYVEPQHGLESNEVICDGRELFGSMEFDMLEYLLDNSLSKKHLEEKLSFSKSVQEIDFVGLIEQPHMEGNLAIDQGRLDCDSIWSVNQILFEEFLFFDLDSYKFFEVFSNLETAFETETCEEMFGKATNFKNFNELIVTHELTLADDYFKSLPVPIISDHEKIKSLDELLKETLEALKAQPSSSSDGIYLDWHLLEEESSKCGTYYSCWTILDEIDTCSLVYDLISTDGAKLVLDFVLSDDSLDGPYIEEIKKILNIPSDGIAMAQLFPNEVASLKLLTDGYHKRVTGEISSDINTEKVSLLAGSMSQFNEFDFFLNPLESHNPKPAVKAFDINATFPVVSLADSIATGATIAVQSQHWNTQLDKFKLSDDILKGDHHSISDLNQSNQKMEEQLNFTPIEEKDNGGYLDAADEVKACCMLLPVPCVPLAMESKQTSTSMTCSPDSIIIVNTQNFETDMIISRRSTYHRILAMEKEGAQVVERDLNLPVDVIVSASVCLAWYNCRNIGKKAATPNEASSSLPLCVENIAVNVLTSLSFTFSSCILVFEGDCSFLNVMMESSDELYAAATSLRVDLQIFCSYSSEMTDDILLGCIGYASKLTRGLYPKIPESETLAESFLTRFPSINPLSAHAILSSGGLLVKFLEWSHEHRICAVQKYNVPNESVKLFSVLVKYGEREDSKSGMTDCSSSVSSAPDSKNCHGKNDFESRKRKYNTDPFKEDLFPFESLKLFTDDNRSSPLESNPYNSWMSTIPKKFDDIGASNVSTDEILLSQKQRSDINITRNPSRLLKPFDFHMSKGHEMSDIKNPGLPMNSRYFGEEQGCDIETMNKLHGRNINNPGNLQENFFGEVIEIDSSSPLAEDFSIANSLHFLPSVPEMKKDPAAEISRTARRLSFGTSSLPTFPRAAEINYDSDARISVRDSGQSSWKGMNQHSDPYYTTYDKMPLKHPSNLSNAGTLSKTSTNLHISSFQQTDIRHYGETPLSNAISSAQPQQGSPWTKEFLNRMKEKSRLRQKCLPRGFASPGFGYSGNLSKSTKPKSPSILDFYRYQGGSTPMKIIEQKREKRSLQPSSSSKNDKTSTSFLPTWTPADKRARRMLTFTKNGSGGQCKLVWSDNANPLNQRF